MPTEARPDPKELSIEMWTLGDYGAVARDLLPVATRLVEAAGVGEGDRVLDVACGSGNVALTAWRRGATVTGSDLVPRMLDLARENAAITGADDVEWREGDAEDLPFGDDSFDAVLSCFGHSVASDADAAGRELVRVAKPGGRIAFTGWTRDGLTGIVLGILGDYLPPHVELPEEYRWGDPEFVRERLGEGVRDTAFDRDTVAYYYLSPRHLVKHLLENVGPLEALVARIDGDDRTAFERDLVDAFEPYVEGNAFRFEYLLTTAVKR